MNKSFSIREAIRYGFNIFKKEWRFLVPLFIGITLFRLITGYLGDPTIGPLGGASGIVSLAAAIIGIFISAGLVKIFLKLYRNQKPAFREVLSDGKSAGKYFLGGLLLALIVFLCLIPMVAISFSFFAGMGQNMLPAIGISFIVILLISLGLVLYFSTMFSFWNVALFDKNLKVIESFKYSKKITKGHRGKLILFMLTLVVFNFLGFVALIVGLLVTVPVSALAQIWVYKKLSVSDTEHISESADGTTTEIVTQPKEIPAHAGEK